MLKFVTSRKNRDCDGTTRRDFIRVGALAGGALSLPGLLRARAEAVENGKPLHNKSVVWLWLAGGPTHVETFDPKMTAPSEYRSVTGEVATKIPGVSVGGTFPKIARVAHKMALVRSFAHQNSGHGGGTHWLMTGYNNRNIDNGGPPSRPSLGSIISRMRGSTHPQSGMPTYVSLGRIGSDGPAFLGTAFAPFDPRGNARRNMELVIDQPRLEDRRALLTNLDRVNRQIDSTGVMDGLDKFEQQAFSLVLGSASQAFDVKGEDPRLVQKYGRGLGENLLKARRLCEAGCGFVTVSYGGWDMHGNIKRSLDSRSGQLDQAVSAFIEDTIDRGLDKDILLVISGEFGRTPKVNKNSGRDHWASLSTLALAGGGLRMGQVIGESAAKVDVPKTKPITPQDLMATILRIHGINPRLQIVNQAGRPVFMVEDGKPISELI